MTTLQHPQIPGLRIERDGAAVDRHVQAGWLRVEEEPEPRRHRRNRRETTNTDTADTTNTTDTTEQ